MLWEGLNSPPITVVLGVKLHRGVHQAHVPPRTLWTSGSAFGWAAMVYLLEIGRHQGIPRSDRPLKALLVINIV